MGPRRLYNLFSIGGWEGVCVCQFGFGGRTSKETEILYRVKNSVSTTGYLHLKGDFTFVVFSSLIGGEKTYEDIRLQILLWSINHPRVIYRPLYPYYILTYLFPLFFPSVLPSLLL